MKKTILTLSVFCAMLFANLQSQAGDITIQSSIVIAVPATISNEWSRADNGAWAGDMNEKSYWYKLDKDKKLWWSLNKGKDWAHVQNQMWADKDGHWLKIVNKNLVWSTDMGKTWSTVPDWTWQGSDGKWYKFDKDWSVWVK
ncbi:MAG: hypothetical protein V4651_02165 [Bacteroidota bacterium]